MGFLKDLSKFFPLKTLDQMCNALVRVHPDYCDIIYHIPPVLNQPPLSLSLNASMEKVERIQYQSALAITGKWQGSSRTKLCEELDGKPYWNNFITHFEHFPTFDSLKALLRPDAKSIFGLHDPIGRRLLFQLRVSLSPILSHKKRYNFIDIPSNICHCNQGIEDTSHFLFSGPSHANERAALLLNVNVVLRKVNLNNLRNQLQLYLYGHQSIIYSDNKKILMSTIKYITETRCFSI